MSAGRFRSFARSWLLQAGWNYDRMQHLGFAFAMMPSLARIFPRPAERGLAVRRHLEYFNTHPFMGAALVGASVRLEEEVAAGRARPDEVVSFKTGIMGSYGAIGDAFFWAAARPLGAVIAVILSLLGAGAWGPAAFVLLYDAIAIPVRAYGFFAGTTIGPMVVAKLARIPFATLTRSFKIASAALSGMAAALWAWHWPGLSRPASEAAAFVLLVAVAGSARRGVAPAGLAMLLAAAAALSRIWIPGLGG